MAGGSNGQRSISREMLGLGNSICWVCWTLALVSIPREAVRKGKKAKGVIETHRSLILPAINWALSIS